jgi:hypothetical protein
MSFLGSAAAARADSGAAAEGPLLWAMVLLAAGAAGLFHLASHERRRETNSDEPLRLKARRRRYNQP